MSSSLRRLPTGVCHPYNRCKSFAVHLAGIISRRLLADSMRCTAGQAITINDLPDDVLLAIFEFYVAKHQALPDFIDFIDFIADLDRERGMEIELWQSLVHVCRRWRGLVFASPRRLNLRLWCTPATSARMSLDVWPALPLIIHGGGPVVDVIAELEHSDRIHQIEIYLDRYTTREIENLWTAMQVPFPDLTALYLVPRSKNLSSVPALPDSFLGGSAPRLRTLHLVSISFRGLPKLLLSATHLVQLRLWDIPHSGYISPEAMATCLSALTSLELFQLYFQSPQSRPDLETQPPFLPTRFVLPTLAEFRFKGESEYSEEFLSRIDAPQVYKLSITFFNDIDFSTPELVQFISRTPTLGGYDGASLIFNRRDALVELRPQPSDDRAIQVKILCQVSGRQLSSLAQICALSFRPLLTMENLYIYENLYLPHDWRDDIEAADWLDLLHPFTAVKNLHVSKGFAPIIAPALQELTGERTTEVFPALQNLFLEGFQASEPVHDGIARFISARQLINRTVVISVWDSLGESEDSEIHD
jgi:hypothetical protein